MDNLVFDLGQGISLIFDDFLVADRFAFELAKRGQLEDTKELLELIDFCIQKENKDSSYHFEVEEDV